MKVIRCSSLPDTALHLLATHLVAEFGHLYPTWDVSAATIELSQDPGQGLPLHIAAIQDGQPLGVTSIILDDEVTGWESRGWWLANVLVLPEYRGRGVGKRLINRAIDIARESGAHELHLATDSTKDWYLKQGWESIDTGDVHGHVMSVMRLALTPSKMHQLSALPKSRRL